jgi:hypothetical protein
MNKFSIGGLIGSVKERGRMRLALSKTKLDKLKGGPLGGRSVLLLPGALLACTRMSISLDRNLSAIMQDISLPA